MTKQLPQSIDSALQNVDENRRGFLGKMLVGTAAAAAIPTMTSVALAQGPDKGKGGKGKGRGGPPDPAQLAKRMIEAHDSDGDGKLDHGELTEALKALRERMRGKGKGKGDGGGKGKGKGKGKGGA